MRLFTVVAALVVLSGCARPWNTANTALEATAMAVAETDEMLVASMAEDHEQARARILRETQETLAEWESCVATFESAEEAIDGCGERPEADEMMERYQEDEEVARWSAVILGLEELREALVTAQAAVGEWRDRKEEPGNWSATCQRLGTVQGSVVRAIEAAGVNVPERYQQALESLSLVCQIGVGYFDD